MTGVWAVVPVKELAGASIRSMSVYDKRLFLQLSGGGSDRVLVLDARNGAVLGVISAP